jgi:hypothetical protein
MGTARENDSEQKGSQTSNPERLFQGTLKIAARVDQITEI